MASGAGESFTIAADKGVEQQEEHEPSEIKHPNCPSNPGTVVVIARHAPSAAHHGSQSLSVPKLQWKGNGF